MRLSKKTRLLGLNVVNYTQYLCDRLNKDDPTDRIAKVRCKNILDQISKNITVVPKGPIQDVPTIVKADVVVLRHFVKSATKEIQRPGLKNLGPFGDKKEFRHDAELLVDAFGQVLNTLLWYAGEKEIEIPK